MLAAASRFGPVPDPITRRPDRSARLGRLLLSALPVDPVHQRRHPQHRTRVPLPVMRVPRMFAPAMLVGSVPEPQPTQQVRPSRARRQFTDERPVHIVRVTRNLMARHGRYLQGQDMDADQRSDASSRCPGDTRRRCPHPSMIATVGRPHGPDGHLVCQAAPRHHRSAATQHGLACPRCGAGSSGEPIRSGPVLRARSSVEEEERAAAAGDCASRSPLTQAMDEPDRMTSRTGCRLKPLHHATSLVRVGVESGAAERCSAAPIQAGVSHPDSEHATMALNPGARKSGRRRIGERRPIRGADQSR